MVSWVFGLAFDSWVVIFISLLCLDFSSMFTLSFLSGGLKERGLGPWVYLLFQVCVSLVLWWAVLIGATFQLGEIVIFSWFTKLGGFIGGLYIALFYRYVRAELLYVGSSNLFLMWYGCLLSTSLNVSVVSSLSSSLSLIVVGLVLVWWIKDGFLFMDVWLWVLCVSSFLTSSAVGLFLLLGGCILSGNFVGVFLLCTLCLWSLICWCSILM
jgi:hypothetical protein